MGILADEMERVKSAADLNAFCEAQGLEHRGRDNYVCPICDSGNGANHSAAFKVQGNRWHCFSCNNGGDVFDLAGVLHGTEDKGEQLRIVAEWAGVPTSRGHESANNATKAEKRPTIRKAAKKPANAPTASAEADYTDGRERHRKYIEVCQGMIGDPEAVAYLKARGFTLEAARRLGLGYDPTARRIVVPWPTQDGEAPYYHTDRAIDEGRQPKYTKPKSGEVGPQPLWGAQATREAAYFIVEGPLDALAVFEAGYWAIATCGASSRDVIEAAASGEGTPVVMLDFDADETKGPKHQADMCAALEAAGHDYLSATPDALQGCKDAAELLEKDPAALKASLDALHAEAVAGRERREAERYAETLSRVRVLSTVEALDMLERGAEASDPVPTGYHRLDGWLSGGLQPKSLYVIGAGSSMGKTTLMLQIADQMAEAGQPVLFVSIEQRATEIAAKSISRFMALDEEARKPNGARLIVPYTDVMTGTRRAAWDEETREAYKRAAARYAGGMESLHVMQPVERPKVTDIAAAAEALANRYGRAPVVFIDYLQLLAQESERDTEKQATDRNITALRTKVAGALNTPVFIVSSLNRGGYNAPLTETAFKESGGIEYGADVLLGLQPRGMWNAVHAEKKQDREDKAEEIIDTCKRSNPRRLEVVVLKNRGGEVYGKAKGLPMLFNAPANLIMEDA